MNPKTRIITILAIAITLSAITTSQIPPANAAVGFGSISPTTGTVNIPVQLNALTLTATSPNAKPITVFFEFGASPGAPPGTEANNGGWNPGEGVVYSADADYNAGEPIVAGQTISTPGGPVGIDPDPLTHLKTDAAPGTIKYIDDAPANGVWNAGERVIFDADDSGTFTAGDIVIAGAPTPAIGTALSTDANLKFIDGKASCATTTTSSSCSALWTFSTAGTFNIRAVAVDTAGLAPVVRTGPINITNPPDIFIDPPSQDGVFPGSTLTYSIMLGSANPATDLDAWEMTVLYDPAVVTAVGLGPAGIPCGPSPACTTADYGATPPFDAYTVVRTPTLDDTIGTVIVGATFFAFPTVGPTGSGTLVQVVFSGDEPGAASTAIHFSDVKLRSVASTQTITLINVVTPSVVTDGSAAVSGTLNFGPTTATANQAQTFTATVTGGTPPYSFSWDFDGDGTPDATTNPATFTYTAEGTFTAFLFVSDTAGASGFITRNIVVSPPVANNPPTLNVPADFSTNELVAMTPFTVTASDPDGDTVTVTATGIPTGMTCTPAPPQTGTSLSITCTWTPQENQDRTIPYTITWTADDGRGAINSIVTDPLAITVLEVNVAPSLTGVPADFSVNENTAITPFTVTASDTDVVNGVPQQVTLSATGIPTGMTCSPALPQTGTSISTTCSWTTTLSDIGVHTVTFSANDGVAPAVTDQLIITVTTANQPPSLTVPGTQVGFVTETVSFDVSADDPDTDQTVTIVCNECASLGATFTSTPGNPATGSLSWTPMSTGSFTFTFVATDSGSPAKFDTKTVVVSIQPEPRLARGKLSWTHHNSGDNEFTAKVVNEGDFAVSVYVRIDLVSRDSTRPNLFVYSNTMTLPAHSAVTDILIVASGAQLDPPKYDLTARVFYILASDPRALPDNTNPVAGVPGAIGNILIDPPGVPAFTPDGYVVNDVIRKTGAFAQLD